MNDVLPADLITRNREVAEAALRPWKPVFMHGDLQIAHVLVDGDELAGVIDWSEAGQGDATHDLASLTLGHSDHLGDGIVGYGADVDVDVIDAWWSLRSLTAIRVTARPCRSHETHTHAAIRAALNLRHCAAARALALVTTLATRPNRRTSSAPDVRSA